MNYRTRFFSDVVSPVGQIIATIITSALAIWMAVYSTREFNPLMPVYHMHGIDPAMFHQWGGEPPRVTVGLHIFKFTEFNFLNNAFEFEGAVWFQFDPALISLDTIEKFSFDYGEILRKSEPHTRLINDQLFAAFDIKVKFMSDVVHRAFPLDDHRLNIALVNYAVSPRELIFSGSTSGFTLSSSISTPGWDIYDKQVRVGYEEAELDKRDPLKLVQHPKAVFSLDLNRSGLKDILLIVLPLFLILFVSLYSLAVDPQKNPNILFALASGSIPAMITYRFVIQNMSPHVSYFMLSDYIFGLFLLFAGLNFLISLILLRIGVLSDRLIVLRGMFFIVFHVVFLAVWYYLMFYFLKTL